MDNDTILKIKLRFKQEAKNDNGERLIEICTHNELRINNTFFDHKPQHTYTRENTRREAITIKYIITNRNVHLTQILDVLIVTKINEGSDNGLLLAKIKLHVKHTSKRTSNSNSKNTVIA